jgi:CheY-like chemotaxis protein
VPDTPDSGIAPLRTGPLILIVDDDQPDRIAATRMVRGLGYPTRSFRQGRDALQFVERHPQVARVLIADLGMPLMDGGELVERVLDAEPTIRAALMADPREPAAAELLEGYRDLPLLRKPLRFADVYGVLTRLAGPPPHGTDAPPASIAAASSWSRRRTSGQFPERQSDGA